jgi:hypothetical protein
LAITERTVSKVSITAEIKNKLGCIKTGRSRDRIDYIRPLDLLILEPFKLL